MISRKRPNRYLDGGKQAIPESLAAETVPELSLSSPTTAGQGPSDVR